MANVKLYIGSEQADFDEVFNIMFSIGDVRDIQLGSNNTSYTLNLPLTKINKRLIKFNNNPSVKSEITDPGMLMFNNEIIIKGKVLVLSITDRAVILITKDDWINQIGATGLRSLEKDNMRDLNLSAYNYTFNDTNVEASFTASDAFYRYPLIYYAELLQGSINPFQLISLDLIPMFRLLEILTELFKPFTITSTFLNTAYFKTQYVLGIEPQSPRSFITGKNLDIKQIDGVDNNYGTITVPPQQSASSTWNQIPARITSETADEANAWNVNQYIVPENGSYRFTGRVHGYCQEYQPPSGLITINESRIDWSLLKNGTVVLDSDIQAWYDDSLNTYFYNIDTGYITLVQGDIITLSISTYCHASNASSAYSYYVNHGTLASQTFLGLSWSKVNLLFGLNNTVEVAKWMPDITQIEFIKGIKDAFNLKIFADTFNRVIYIEPFDTFISDNVIDLTPYIDYTNPPNIDIISKNYSKKLTLKWKQDDGDLAVKEYLINNTIPYTKEINMNSVYCTPGNIDYINSVFAFTPKLKAQGYYLPSWDLPAIWGDTIDDTLKRPDVRNPQGLPRLFEWKGMTANPEGSWYMNGNIQTQYPKVEPLDMAILYSSYFIRTFHWIDQGKIITIMIKPPLSMITQFTRVMSTATNEGFRPTYKLYIEDQYFYGIVNKVITNGELVEIELLIKQ